MKIIDAHIHTNFSDKEAAEFIRTYKIDYTWEGLQNSLDENKIEAAIAITGDHTSPTPGQYEMLREQANKDPRLKIVVSIHPQFTKFWHVKTIKKLFEKNLIAGIKIYPAYHPVYPNDKRYFPFYKLAGQYKKPVIVHTGDTFGSQYLVKYSHPLSMDEVAVAFPQTTFILAHLGNPWVRDAAELVYKNENVYADLSAFCIGHQKTAHKHIIDDIRYALEVTGRPDKFIYGSDWPLVEMKDYIKIIKKAVPKKHHKQVFYENAKLIFNL